MSNQLTKILYIMKKITFFTVLLTLFMWFGGFAQNTWYVTSPANGGSNVDGDGSQSFPFATPFFANSIASAGDTIIIDGEVNQPGAVNLTKSLTFSGINNAAIVGAPQFEPQGRLFAMPSDPLDTNPPVLVMAFNNIEFRNFEAADEFGDPIPAVSGVIFNNQGRPNVQATFTDCVFNGNISSANGGAIFINNNVLLTLNDCLFRNNTAAVSGGGLYINSVDFSPTVNITGTTFYQNLAQGTLGSNGGGAILIEGVGAQLNGQLNIFNSTFYQNYTTKASVDYGAIRCTNSNVLVTNSLFYENKIDGGTGASSDFGSAPGGIQSFTYSIGEWISNNVDTRNNFKAFVKLTTDPNEVAANLTSSNLAYDAASGLVKYTLPATGDDSPIDFGSDGNDVGAWNSGFTLSLDREDFLATQFTVFFNKASKNLEVLHTINAPLSVEIYNIIGAKVLTVDEVASKQSINANGLKAGIYILLGKTPEKFFSKKFIVN